MAAELAGQRIAFLSSNEGKAWPPNTPPPPENGRFEVRLSEACLWRDRPRAGREADHAEKELAR